MNIWAGRVDAAANLASTYLGKYPNDLHMLNQLKFMMGWAKREDEFMRIQKRINEIIGGTDV